MKSAVIFLAVFLVILQFSNADNQSSVIAAESDSAMVNIHSGPKGHKRFQIVTINFEKVKLPLGVVTCLIFATLVKIGEFHN